MTRTNGTIIRCVSIILLVCLCAGSVLYVNGFFEFTFIDRHPAVPTDGPTDTSTYIDSYISSALESTGVGDSITSIRPPEVTTSPSGTTNQGSDTQSGSVEVTTPSDNRFSPVSVTDLIANGYLITYENYTKDMVIAEVPLPQSFSDFKTGTALFRESALALNYSDESFKFSELVSTKRERYTVESYMGYVLISTAEATAVYDYTGYLVFLSDVLLSPAYTRDRENRPLYFTKNTKEFYYIDFEQKLLVLSDYNDEADGRGLYFNYNPSFGLSDNKYSVFYTYADYTRQFSINLGSSWQKANVSHLIAKELYLMYPVYANSVARANKRFAAALTIAKKEIAKENADKATATTLPETTLSPEVTTPSPETTQQPEEITAPETTVSPEVTVSPDVIVTEPDTSSPEVTVSPTDSDSLTGDAVTSSPDGDTSSGEGTSDDTTTEELTTPAETTSKYPSDALTGYDTVTKVFHGIRFGIGTSAEKLSYAFKAAKAYNFSEKRAAVVDDFGRLTFLNTSFKTAINGYKKFNKVIEGAGQSVYYIRNYFEPLYRDMRGLGHLYFDSGYVMVRCVEVRTMKNKIADRDENFLLNTSGSAVLPPDGYTLVTCTEGIMVLERNGRYGYYEPSTQTWIAQPIYTYIEPFYEGIGVIGIAGGNVGAIDKEGNIVIPFNYSYVSTMSTGLISVYSADFGWQVFAKLSK